MIAIRAVPPGLFLYSADCASCMVISYVHPTRSSVWHRLCVINGLKPNRRDWLIIIDVEILAFRTVIYYNIIIHTVFVFYAFKYIIRVFKFPVRSIRLLLYRCTINYYCTIFSQLLIYPRGSVYNPLSRCPPIRYQEIYSNRR